MPLNETQERLCSESRWDFSDLKAMFLNCTLNKSSELSHTQGLIDIAIASSDQPEYHGTRGLILAAKGQLQGAITELEVALGGHPNPAWVHEQLADLYGQIGVEDLAKVHAKSAARLQTTQGQ